MTRRRPPTILDFFPPDEVDPRTWAIREHSRLRLYWRRLRPQLWPIAEFIATTLLRAFLTFIVVLVSLSCGSKTARGLFSTALRSKATCARPRGRRWPS